MAEIASAPASSTARATARTSPAAALSLAISGRSVARRTADTGRAALSGSRANATPPRDAVAAREVELDPRDARHALELAGEERQVTHRLPGEAHDHRRRPAGQGDA